MISLSVVESNERYLTVLRSEVEENPTLSVYAKDGENPREIQWLVNAAPDLLAALKEAKEVVAAMYCEMTIDRDSLAGIASRILAAISKAEPNEIT